jgi:hypothetical protein
MLLIVPGRVEPSEKSPISAPKDAEPGGRDWPESALSLLLVNHQIHDEAVVIFYHHNKFIFHYSLHLHAFLLSLGWQRQDFIRDITVHYADFVSGGMSLVELTFDLLKNMKGLRKLDVLLHGDLARKIIFNYQGTRTMNRKPSRTSPVNVRILTIDYRC